MQRLPDRVVRQAAALLLVLLPAADVFPLAPPVVPAALRERGPGALPLRPPPRCPRTRAPAGACALAAMAAFEEGDRVEFLVKTVAFSRKIMANGMTSTGLTGASCRMSRAPTRVSTEQACFNDRANAHRRCQVHSKAGRSRRPRHAHRGILQGRRQRGV